MGRGFGGGPIIIGLSTAHSSAVVVTDLREGQFPPFL